MFSQSDLPRLVMFDLDGTLIDSVPDLATAIDQMLLHLGRPPAGVEQVRNWIGNGAPVLVRRALAGSLEHSQVPETDAAYALELFSAAYAGSKSQTKVYPGVLETLGWLKSQHIELALITNKAEQFIAPLLDSLNLGGFFRWIIGGDTLPQRKPDPAALLHVLHMAGVAPEQALFVGDSRNDVIAARAAGVRSVAVSYGYNHGRPIAEEAPDWLIDDLRELRSGCTNNGAALMSTHS